MSPWDRIKKRLTPEKSAALDRALDAFAARYEQLADAKGAAQISLTIHVHAGDLAKVRFDPDLEFR